MHHLLNRAHWDTDGIAADLRDYVVDHPGEPDAILVVDETGDLKKGECTVGVQCQYTGTAGRIENTQVAVYLAYTSRTGHALIDRELYLPRCWGGDPDRRAAAGVPDEVDFATEPALAATMVARAVAAGVPARWASGDEVYGADPDLRACLEELGLGYVLAIGCNRQVRTHGGPMRADRIADALPEHCWQRLSAGAGAKGARIYRWAFITLGTNTNTNTNTNTDTDTDRAGGYRWLLVRRHPDTGELAYHPCWSPTPVPLGELVRVAGARWSIEEAVQASKTLSGLDEHQVRRWTPWRRWTLVSMLGHALLAATEHIGAQDAGLIPLTCHEIARLLNRMRVRARQLANPP